jgi:ABC-type transporter Mla subunit MlaD
MNDTPATSIDEELHALARPLYDRLLQVEHELETIEATARRVRDNRNKLRTALRAVDPTYAQTPATPRGNRAPTKGVASDTVEEITRLLRDMPSDVATGGIMASALARRDGWPYSQATTSAALKVLHTRGVIRLDHTGTGGGKWYRLV